MKANLSSTTTSVKDKESPESDHWGQPVIFHDDPATGAGEQCECQRCGERLNIALIGGTDPNASGDKWQEFYRCNCGAEGSLRVSGTRRRWTGMIGAPEGQGLLA